MQPTRALAALAAAALLAAGLTSQLGAPASAAPSLAPAGAASPDRVTVMGSLMDELGCGSDWDETCTATDMTRQPGGTWTLEGRLPAGEYQWKVRLDGAWAENYGAFGQADGDNVTLTMARRGRVRFSYDEVTHQVWSGFRDQRQVTDTDRSLARNAYRGDLTHERMYFVMADRFDDGDPSNDRGGYGGGRLVNGYDPTDTGFYHGGDLQGVIDRLDYIQGLGSTAIWLTPSFVNKPVQGAKGSKSAGYHGYWITDFTRIDPHLGTNADMQRLVRLAHQRGMKVFFDIITNHTADVITYDRSQYTDDGTLPYVSKDAEPYRDANGDPFDDADYASAATASGFPKTNLRSFPYRPVLPAGEGDAKTPAWLNDPRLYHNRGTSSFAGESNTYGDFPSVAYSALDDLWTENPRVVNGMVGIYRQWVRKVGIDGFRIDTVKHVNTEFWQQFSPALTDYAAEQGNDAFFMFGEVYDANPEFVSQYTTTGRLQAAVDFGFQAAASSFAQGGPASAVRGFYAGDDWYTDRDSNAASLPTFLGNHDMGRIGSFLRANDAGFSERELLRRDELAHALMFTTRGQPVVYYGDEQGFSAPKDVPDGPGDQRAREDMFGSQVDLYNSYDLIGTDGTTATQRFRPRHPLYREIAALSALRQQHPTLADGAQVQRYASDGPGIYAFSRVNPRRDREYVVAVNNATTEQHAMVDTFSTHTRYDRLWPARGAHLRSGRQGRISVTVPPLSAVVYRASRDIVPDGEIPAPFFTSPSHGQAIGRQEVAVDVPGDSFTQTTFAWRPAGKPRWRVIGTDDSAPFRVFHDVRGLEPGTQVEYRAVTKDADGDIGSATTSAVVARPATNDGGPDTPPASQPDAVSVPGTFNSEVGCASDWMPDCPAIDLGYDAEDQVWSTTFTDPAIPRGSQGYKVAIDDSWDVNYGAGGTFNGENVNLDADGGPVTFWYSDQTHWVTSSAETPHLYTAAGSFQSEMGCNSDWDPSCLRSWLQDPDGNGIWAFRTRAIPPGDYETKATADQSFDTSWGAGGDPHGADIAFTVADGEGVRFLFDETTHVLTVDTYPIAAG